MAYHILSFNPRPPRWVAAAFQRLNGDLAGQMFQSSATAVGGRCLISPASCPEICQVSILGHRGGWPLRGCEAMLAIAYHVSILGHRGGWPLPYISLSDAKRLRVSILGHRGGWPLLRWCLLLEEHLKVSILGHRGGWPLLLSPRKIDKSRKFQSSATAVGGRCLIESQ